MWRLSDEVKKKEGRKEGRYVVVEVLKKGGRIDQAQTVVVFVILK